MAVLVAASHIIGSLKGYAPGRLLSGAYLAVDYFFILSGFVLSYVIAGKGLSFRQVIMMRIRRLWPLHCMAIVICFLIYKNNAIHGLYYPTQSPLSWGTFWENVLFLSNSGIPAAEMLNDPAWSITVEFWLSAFVLYWIIKAGPKFSIVISLLGYVTIILHGRGLMMQGEQVFLTSAGMVRGIAGMCLGAFLYAKLDILERCLTTLSRRALDGLLFICLFGMLVGMAKSEGGLHDLFAVFLIVPFFAYTAVQKNSVICSKFLSSKTCIWLGSISFSLYLIHTPIIILLLPPSYVPDFGKGGAFLITIATSIACAYLVHVAFEKAIDARVKIVEKWLLAKRGKSATSASA